MSRSVRQFVVSFLPAALWYAGIWWLSSQSKLPGPGDESWRDFLWFKTAHLLAYAALSTLLWLGTYAWKKKQSHRAVIVWCVVLSLAIIDEIHQSFVPGRHPRATDVVIDTSGSGAVLFMLERYNVLHSLPQEWRKKFGM